MRHRIPPKPLHYKTAPVGHCRYCGGAILNAKGMLNKRARWHPDCLDEYKIIYWPQETRKAVFERDRGICGVCGAADGYWEMDHHRPLFEARGRIEFWKLPNLVTLCRPCHVAKTSAEATARAEKRRLGKKK